MRIAIMGSGGVGAYVGSRLQAAGEDVSFIARGAHLEAMRRDGLRIESPVHPLHLPSVRATENPSDIGPVDLIIFAVKLGDTETAARSLGPMIGEPTRILTLQNGIDSIGMIAPHVAGAQVRGGVIYVSAVIDRPGVIRSPGGLYMIVADAAKGDPVMAEFFAACARHRAGCESNGRHRYCHLGEVHRLDCAIGFNVVAAREHGPDTGAYRSRNISAATDRREHRCSSRRRQVSARKPRRRNHDEA